MKTSTTKAGSFNAGINRGFDPAAFVRTARNSHRSNSRWSAAADIYQTLLGAVVILMYAGSLLYGVQQDLVAGSEGFMTRPLVSGDVFLVPAPVALHLLLLLATAHGLVLACRTGPVAVDRAQGYWWLSLPVDRRKLVRGPVVGKLVWAATGAALAMVPVVLLLGPANGFSSTALASITTACLVAVVFSAAAAVQLLGKQALLERCIHGLAVVVLLVLLLPLVVPSSSGFLAVLSTVLPWLPTSWPLAVAQGSFWPLFATIGLAVLGTFTVYTRLNGLRRADLVAAGGVTGHAGSALYFGDFRELGRALQVDRVPHRSFGLSRWAPASPAGILVFTDVAAFLRKPRLVATLTGLALLPAAIALIEGMGSAVLVAVVLFFTGWRVADVSSTVAKEYADRPALERLLPLGRAAQLRLHAVLPLLAAGLWSCCAFSLLAFLGASGEGPGAFGLVAMGLISSVGLAGAGMRMAHRAMPDWSALEGPTSPTLQSGNAIGSHTRGPDMVFLAMLPVLLAVVAGVFVWWLVVLQCVTAVLCLWLGTRRS